MARRWAWLLVLATAACSVAEAVVMRTTGMELLSVSAFRNAFPLVNLATVVGALVGAVILTRHPRHRIGWLFCWGQLGVACGLLLRAIADATAEGVPTAGPRAGQLADLGANLLGAQFALLLLAVLLVLAPNGELPSRRWRLLLALLVVSYLCIIVGLVLVYGNGLTPANNLVLAAGQLGVLGGLVASVVAVLLRLRRSTGETRQQLRWISAAAAVLASAPVAAVATNVLGGDELAPAWVLVLLHVGYLGVPVATGFAVLRYRLYDIDRLMGGSVVLAVLAALALVGYVAAIGLVGLVLPGVVGSGWLSALVFVGVVLAFQPLRRYVRRLADRLVYGRESMSYQALARFTRQLATAAEGPSFLLGVAEAAGRLVNARRCTAVVIGPDGPDDPDGSGQAETWSDPARRGPDPVGSRWSVPVVHQGVLAGRLEVELPDYPTGAAQRRELLASLADQVADGFAHARLELALRREALQLQRLNDELDASRQRLLDARDIGRRRVAARIRQQVIDRLAPIATTVHRLAESPDTVVSSAAAQVESALTATTEAIEQLRQITSTVYSRPLAEHGLAAALQTSAPGRVQVVGSARWSAAVESALFACCVDLLSEHDEAVTVELATREDTAEVTLGVAAADHRWSLDSTRERLEVLGGQVEQRSGRLVLRLPLIEADVPA